MLKVLNYDLPDYKIFSTGKSFETIVWQPDATYLVLGQSNNIESSLFTDKVIQDAIPVYKRPSGGETVILTPNMLVIAVVFKESKLQNPKVYFEKTNNTIINILTSLGYSNLCKKGISDISIGEKKILGSSIYRKTSNVFYHAVLNVSEDVQTISKYIKHPQKEPDYRKGRSHVDFVTSLSNYSVETDIIKIKTEIQKTLVSMQHMLMND